MIHHSQDVIAFVRAALECSVYLAPLDPGLSYEDLLVVGKAAGYQEGEIDDAIHAAHLDSFGYGRRFKPDVQHSN